MNLLAKLENLINQLLLKLAGQMLKLVSPRLLHYCALLQVWKQKCIDWFKSLPPRIIQFALKLLGYFKQNFVTDLKETFVSALNRYKTKRPKKQLGKLKMVFLAPFLMISQWLQGLSAAHSMLLLTFSAASIIAGINMVFSGQRLAKGLNDTHRTPASLENEDEDYARPEYYKKQLKHLTVTSLRVPVYVAEVNELRSVDVDFTITLSNRQSKQLLAKKEFQLRDHLILNVEPSVASFNLQEEGKEILRQKFQEEVDVFLQENGIPGKVAELKITYILAN